MSHPDLPAPGAVPSGTFEGSYRQHVTNLPAPGAGEPLRAVDLEPVESQLDRERSSASPDDRDHDDADSYDGQWAEARDVIAKAKESAAWRIDAPARSTAA